MRRTTLFLILLLLGAIGCADTPTPPAGGADNALRPAAPFNKLTAGPADSMRVFVRLKDDLSRSVAVDLATAVTAQHDRTPIHVIRNTMNAFTAVLPMEAIEGLRRNPYVAFITEDVRVPDALQSVSWGLDRLDQRDRPLDQSFTSYFNGAGTNIYVLDSGIEPHTAEFGSRLRVGWTFDDDYDALSDCNGHGTSVASVAGGNTVGVAPGALLWAVRIDGCSTSPWIGDMVAGVDWVAGHAYQGPAVANLSFGVPLWYDNLYWGSLEEAVKDMIDAGVTAVVAAGNDDEDACDWVPARIAQAVTVGALDASDDERLVDSNHGNCVNLHAPGEYIRAASNDGTGYGHWTGTSHASPYVAGIAAAILDQRYAPPVTIKAVIENSGTNGRMDPTTLEGSPDLMAFSQFTHAYFLPPNYRLINVQGTFEWSVRAWGGTGSYSYSWEVSEEGGPWTEVGTGSTWSKIFGRFEGCYDWGLRVTVNFGNGETETRSQSMRTEIGICPQ